MHFNSRLLAKYISQECTKDEIRLIEERIQNDDDFAKFVNVLKRSTTLKEAPSRPINVDDLWLQFKQNENLKAARESHANRTVKLFSARDYVKPVRSYRLLRYAAILIFAISISYFISDGFINLPWKITFQNEYRVVNVKNGERLNINLVDGSSVTVDAGSEFKFFTNYRDERHVYLKGEAFFNVAPDPQRPFYVHACHAQVRVVGTRFNVKAWKINPTIAVTVADGKVSVTRDDLLHADSTLLSKGEQCTVPLNGPPSVAVSVVPEDYTLWMHNEIHFKEARVGEVIEQLKRWYDYQFEFQDQNVLNEKISVHIQSVNVNEVIEVISLVTETEVIRDGHYIKFLKKKNK